LAEQQFRRAVAISQGDLTVFFTRPLSATILAIAAVALLTPLMMTYWQRRRDLQATSR
jgi:putative tricarboxylic transport membrane protein